MKSKEEKTKKPFINPLILKAKQGETRAFDVLIRPILGSLFSLAKRLFPKAPEDLLQYTLKKAWENIGSFRGDCSFKTWIIKILYNSSKEPSRFWINKNKEIENLYLREDIPERLELGPLFRITTMEILKRVEEAMERLPKSLRTALHLRAVEGMTYKEISSVLGITEATARVFVVRARKRLIERLGDYIQ